MSQNAKSQRRKIATALKSAYIRILLLLLPMLLAAGRHLSKKIRNETDYLAPGYTFALTVAHTDARCLCQKTKTGSWKRIPRAQEDATAITYLIEFRDKNYAFACFSGGLTLQNALAARLFTTRGPNNTGVALTYMFTALLHAFFFWRTAYRTSSTRRSSDASL
ncbi:MAG: D-alanyl-D-alanine carboxypeptidase [Eggerthellaceae bacterium]